MENKQPAKNFTRMAFLFKIRDLYRPRMVILQEVGIKAGDRVLDYGCGPGSYIIPLNKLTGSNGKIYALDINPQAIQMVRQIISKKQLTNVETILSACETGLPAGSIDVVLLYDILHHLKNPLQILKELQRVLKNDGILSVSDHHMKENEIVSGIISGGLFRLSKKGKRTVSFAKQVL